MKTTSLIGRRCKHSNVFSLPVLITRGLDLQFMQAFKALLLLCIVQFLGRKLE
jgi:hypothetical protein